MLEYRNIKTCSQKVIFQNSLRKILSIKKSKILCRGLMLLVILTVKKLLEFSTKNNCKIQIKKTLELQN